jgi:ubiquinone/menaquinone biosynthesis C-methylase UbiE
VPFDKSRRGLPVSEKHWNKIYKNKSNTEMSWFQNVPDVSLKLIKEFKLPPNTRIIDIGGGDSMLVDYLLERGFNEISVLDISSEALARAKERLGNKVCYAWKLDNGGELSDPQF